MLMGEVLAAMKAAVDQVLDKLTPPVKMYRSTCTRQVDELGRVVLDVQMRRMCDLEEKDAVLLGIVLDEQNRVRGIICEPLEWVITPEKRPTFEEALAKLADVGRNGRKAMQLMPGPDLTKRRGK